MDSQIAEIERPLVDLALGRPATQSSVGLWSAASSTVEDAAFLVDGVIDRADRDYGNHTGSENSPWWQVDLGEDFVVNQVLVFNRASFAERLGSFTILASSDGVFWLPIFQRVGATLPDRAGHGFIAEIERPHLARFVRIRADDHGVLHLRAVKVFGRKPNLVEIQAANAAIGARRAQHENFIAGRNGQIGTVGGFDIFADERYGAAILNSLHLGNYEGKERDVLRAVLRAHDRVIEVGTAIGVITMTAAAIVGAENVLTYEANPYIVKDARRNFEYNELGDIVSINAVLKPRSHWHDVNENMPFALSQEFWASRLGATMADQDIVEIVDVPTAGLEDAIKSHRANFLICDIEGGEIDLLLDADLTGVTSILMETHYWSVGRKATSDLFRRLIEQGFDLNLDFSAKHVSYFERGLT